MNTWSIYAQLLVGHACKLFFNCCRSGGIEIKGLCATAITRLKAPGKLVLEKYVFVPNETSLSLEQSLQVNLQIVLENSSRLKIKIVELNEGSSKDIVAPMICHTLNSQPMIKFDIVVVSTQPLEVENIRVTSKPLSTETDAVLVIVNNGLSSEKDVLHDAFKILVENGGVLSREPLSFDCYAIKLPENVELLTVHTTPTEKLVLLTQPKFKPQNKVVDISDTTNFAWLPCLQEAVKDNSKNVVVLARNDNTNGILGFVNCLRKEPGCQKTTCVFLQDKAPDFNSNDAFYKDQLDKGFVTNVYKHGKWGTYRHLLLNNSRKVMTEHCVAEVTVRGDLSSAKWLEGDIDVDSPEKSLQPDEELVYVSLYFEVLEVELAMILQRCIKLNFFMSYAGYL